MSVVNVYVPMPIFSSALVTPANRRKNHLYLISPASFSLSVMFFYVASSVIYTVVSIYSLLKAHRSVISSQPTPARIAEVIRTNRI